MVPSLGSAGGVKAVMAGAIDLAAISRPLKEAERAQGAVATDYARTPFVFATAAATKVSAITQRELLSIYAGDTKTWPNGKPLRLLLRPADDSDTDLAKSLSPAMKQAVPAALARAGLVIELTDQTNAYSLETIPGALGTSTLAQIMSEKRALQPLALDGVVPSVHTLDDGSYRYFKTFSFVSTAKASPLVQQFMAFVQSPAGRQILEKNGHSQVSGK
jgi:phosphate transport system substrate-binding protein